MKLILIFIGMDLLTIIAYPIILLYSKLVQLLKKKEIPLPAHQ